MIETCSMMLAARARVALAFLGVQVGRSSTNLLGLVGQRIGRFSNRVDVRNQTAISPITLFALTASKPLNDLHLYAVSTKRAMSGMV
jgi:hypothetical protein